MKLIKILSAFLLLSATMGAMAGTCDGFGLHTNCMQGSTPSDTLTNSGSITGSSTEGTLTKAQAQALYNEVKNCSGAIMKNLNKEQLVQARSCLKAEELHRTGGAAVGATCNGQYLSLLNANQLNHLSTCVDKQLTNQTK